MSAIEVLLTSHVVAGLVAAALYAATYLSFVRLLRYPRNWLAVRPMAIVATGFLATLTILWVAVSPGGLDLASLTGSACFIAAALFVIASPAVAFKPANGVVEFFAKHADHAGLWLIAPAVVAALTVPNAALLGLLICAMAIELSWFWRQRRRGRPSRQRHPLNSGDLAVLQTQAKGDIEAFRARHGIRELVLTESAVSWQGCGKHTSPCPFNLYVNRLGLNTAPCCREHMHDIAHYTAACLREIGAVYWLEGGSLLGAVREQGALLAWEDDIDISVLLDADMTWERLSSGIVERCARDGYHVELFEQETFIGLSFDAPKSWPFSWERSRLRGEIRVDIAMYSAADSYGEPVLERQSYKGAMTRTESGGYGVPRDCVLPTSNITFLSGDFACPNMPEDYLRILYGDFEKIEYTYIDPAAAETRHQAELD